MNCREAERQISDRMDSSLSAATQQALDSHLAACPACARLNDHFHSLSQGAAALKAIEPSSAVADRVVSRWKPLPNRLSWRPVILTAGAAAAIALVAFSFRPTGVSPQGKLTNSVAAKPDLGLSQKSAPKFTGYSLPEPMQGPAAARSRSTGLSRLGWHVEPVSTPARLMDDLAYINPDPAQSAARWSILGRRDLSRIERLLASVRRTGDDFVSIPYPPIASTGSSAERAAIASYQKEAAVVDPRLTRKLTLGVKGVSFEALCKRLKDELGVDFAAGRNVADDKVTIFCKEKPVRDLMRQITRVFGFAWRRTGEPGAYAYELTQDLKSQLLEEELRNRDKNEALLALDKEMEKLRDLAKLSPDELRERANNAEGEEKKKLENLARYWGAAQMYYNLSPDEMSALRSGQELKYSSAPGYGAQPLPESLKSGIFQSMGDVRIQAGNGELRMGNAQNVPNGKPPAEVEGAFAQAGLSLDRSELGETKLEGMSGVGVNMDGAAGRINHKDPLGVGMSPSVQNPRNATVNAKLATAPEMKKMVTIATKASTQIKPDRTMPAPPEANGSTEPSGPAATSADVLEAIHQATGMDVVGDYFTRLYTPDQVSSRNATVFAAVSRICDTMRVKWNREEGWLQFRSAGYFHDRLKEVPNRLLERWAAKRKEAGTLGTDELIEIASLNEAQLNSTPVALGARALYGLEEWTLASNGNLRPNWRFLAAAPVSFRKAILSEKGASLSTLPPSAQQKFLSLVVAERNPDGLRLEDIPQTTLKLSLDPSAMNGDQPAAQNERPKSAVEFKYTHALPEGGNWVWTTGPFSDSINTDGPGSATNDIRNRRQKPR
jgi:hypothetical protein